MTLSDLFCLACYIVAIICLWEAGRKLFGPKPRDWRAQARRYLSGYLEGWTDERGSRALRAALTKLTNEQLRGG